MANCVFINFNYLALVLSEILGGPKFTLGGPALPRGPVALAVFSRNALYKSTFYLLFYLLTSGKILTCAQVLAYIYIIAHFQLRSSIHAGLTERSLYNRFCIERSAKMGFWGNF